MTETRRAALMAMPRTVLAIAASNPQNPHAADARAIFVERFGVEPKRVAVRDWRETVAARHPELRGHV